MSINVGQAIGYLDLDTSGFQKGFKSALQDLRAFNDDSATATTKLGALGSAFTSIGSSMTKNLTVPIAGAGAAVVGVAAKFESAMSEVEAISGASGDALQALTDKAQEMGATTKFSASESAEALKYMAMAGWKTEEMLDGIEGVMNLAAASGEDLATTSDIVTDALTAFGLSASDSSHFADVLAAASNSANTNVSMLGESFKYVAPVAGSYGYSVEDVSIALGLMANSGIKASQAGTSLRGALSKMVKPTEKAAIAMDEYNISLFNADGSSKSLMEVMQNLRDVFGENDIQIENSDGTLKSYQDLMNEAANGTMKLTDQQKLFALSTIFGTESLSGMLAVINTSETDFNRLAEAINTADGTAQDMADTMLDNLSGQLTILKSTLEGIAISFGNILLPAVKSVVEALQSFLNWVNGLTDGQKQLVVTIAAVVAAIGPVLLIVGKLITAVTSIINAVNMLKPAFAALNAVMAANPIGIVVVAIAGLIAALVALYNKNEAFRDFVNAAWAKIKETIGGVVGSLVNFFTVTIPETIDSVISWFQTLADNVANFFTVVIPEKINELVQWFTELPERIGYAIGFAIGTLANWVVSLAQKAAEVGPKVIDAIVNFFSQLPGKVWNFLVQTVTNFGNWIVQTKEKALTVGAQIIDTVVSFFLQLPGKIWNTLLSAIAKIKQWKVDIISWAKTAIPDVISTIMGFFEELPGKMFEIGKNLLLGLADGISNAVGAVLDTVGNAAKSIVKGFKDAFGIHSPSKETANMGTMLMKGLSNGISDSLYLVKKQMDVVADTVTGALDSVLPSARAVSIVPSVPLGKQSVPSTYDMGSTLKASASTVTNNYVFNSPKAVVPTVAAKLLKQTAQQISMSIK